MDNSILLSSPRGTTVTPHRPSAAQADKTATEFETVFLSQAFKSMFENVSMGSFGSSHATETWKSFLSQEYARTVAECGATAISRSVSSMINTYKDQENKNG